VPTAELLARYAATQDRTLWWRARLERCYATLAER
jgi:o-succinylbenzoate synthase